MNFQMIDGICGYSSGKTILKGINFSVSSGEVLCILGANGAGKSTLFKSILGLIRLQGGRVEFDGEDVRRWSRPQFARSIGYIPQATNPPFSFSVMDIILMGRTAYLGNFASPKKEDWAIAERTIEELGIGKLADKKFLQLSGGERQLVLIARALTQNPKVLVMDEPTAALDFGNQQLVLNQVKKLSERGLAIIMASHFPDHAFLYGSKALLLKDGSVYYAGTPNEVISEESLLDLYRVRTRIIDTGITSGNAGRDIKICVPLT